MFVDYVLNGQGFGSVGEGFSTVHYDPHLLRPYVGEDGVKYVTMNTGRVYDKDKGRYVPKYEEVPIRELATNRGMMHPAWNALSLRKDEWIQYDTAILEVARQRLRAWSDLAASESLSGFDGMSKMVLEHETVSDPGEAIVDMDGISEGRGDSPIFQLEGTPLPIIHASFTLSARRLAISRNGNTPLNTLLARSAGRRVAETVEKLTIGVIDGPIYGNASLYGRTPSIYGYTNFPNRIVKTDMVAPTGANGEAVLSSWLALREELYDQNMYGPYMVYTSSDWDLYLDNLFSTSEPSAGTLRSRLLQIDGIRGIRRLDYLDKRTNPFTVLMVQMTGDVARAVIGMPITTVQWESRGGEQLHFKVMCIQVPQLFADYEGQCGIAHGTAAAA